MWNVFTRSRATATLEPPKPTKIDLWSDLDGGESRSLGYCDHDTMNPRECAQVDYVGRIAVITILVQEMRHHSGALMMADLLDRVVRSGAEHIVFDLQNVIYMDSGCVGCLIDALNRLSRNGGRIALASPAPCVTHLLSITRLDRVFPICSDVLAAICTVERER